MSHKPGMRNLPEASITLEFGGAENLLVGSILEIRLPAIRTDISRRVGPPVTSMIVTCARTMSAEFLVWGMVGAAATEQMARKRRGTHFVIGSPKFRRDVGAVLGPDPRTRLYLGQRRMVHVYLFALVTRGRKNYPLLSLR